ncbi:unnamed protein product [Cutaneotrichosporon oleaginosum]
MNNNDRMKIRYKQIQWFMGGKAAGHPWPHSPPDSLRLWTPKSIWKQEVHVHHRDSTLEPSPVRSVHPIPAPAAGSSRNLGA